MSIPRRAPFWLGSDADIVVWDPERSKTITADKQVSAIDYNVFEGKAVKGLPRFTLSRGKVVVEESTLKTEEGYRQIRGSRALSSGQQGIVDLEGAGGSASSGTHWHSGFGRLNIKIGSWVLHQASTA